ncbi:MAG: prolipoprotein diacylglyceryl transferase [Lachnospiraceae bacterium]|nr:prolipoprotein diacylglyceryl transferase [Lachnospiraceae bacterium]
MDYRINFPHLGIFLEHVGKNITIGNFTIAYYGIAIAIGMLLGIWAVTKRAEETGQKGDDYIDIVLYAMVFGIIGARIYYVIFAWDMYKDNPISAFNIRQGGLAIYGGLICGVITIYVVSRIKKMSFPKVLDIIAIGIPIGQIIGRWGNFFNREAFGKYTDGLLAMQLPVSAVRQNEITAEMWEHVVNLNGVDFIQVHPTFLYEGMWNVLVLLTIFFMRRRIRFDGELFAIYIAMYSFGRFFIETLRTDQLLLPGTDIPVSMVVAAVIFCFCLLLILRKRGSGTRS